MVAADREFHGIGRLDDRFHETTQLHLRLSIHGMSAVSSIPYDSIFENARLGTWEAVTKPSRRHLDRTGLFGRSGLIFPPLRLCKRQVVLPFSSYRQPL